MSAASERNKALVRGLTEHLMERKKLLIALVLVSCGWMIERQAPETREFVEGVVPIGLAELSAQIRDGVLGEKDVDGSTVHLPGKAVDFPYREYRSFSVADWAPHENTWPPLGSLIKDDPAMDRYLRLPPEARKDDILLQGGGVSEWYSEYTAFGKLLPFYCDFIIHLQEDGPGQTRVEVLEYNPRVKFGKRFVIGHGGPAFVTDAKLVSPTTKDRVEMLERIRTLKRPPVP